ncbi:MAG: hypothetical protein QW620_06470 [Thermoplasmata archaeon]
MNEREILLDNYGPYMSALGSVISIGLWFLNAYFFLLSPNNPLPSNFGIAVVVLSYLLPYFMCTCIHNRKSIFYSSGSLGALIGAIIGVPIFSFLGGLGFLGHSPMGEIERVVRGFTIALIFAPIPPLFTFLGARYMCKRAERKLSQKEGLNHRRA